MKFSPRMVWLCLALMAILAILLASVSFVASELKSKAAGAGSHTYYVSKTGDNADGLSWTTAWNELNQINWSVIQPGDTLLLDGGTTSMTYTTTLNIIKSGTATAPITVKLATDSGHNGQAIIFGGRSTPLPYCGQTTYTYQTAGVLANGVNFNANSYVIVDGTKWNGITDYGHNSDGIIFANGASYDTVRNMDIYDNGSADSNYTNNTWETDKAGIRPIGTNLTFEQIDIHDNGQDNFQSGGPLNNFTLRHSWLHYTRQNPTQPTGVAFNFPCTHQDGIQVYGGGTEGNYLLVDSIIGPGLMQGTIMGEAPDGNGNSAVVNNVTIRITLFLNAGSNNMMAYPNINNKNWQVDHVTSFLTPAGNPYIGTGRTPPGGTSHAAFYIDGTGTSIVNSVIYGGNIHLPNGATGSGNCQWQTTNYTSAIAGQTIDPKFVTDVSNFSAWPNYPSMDQLTNTDFSLQTGSPCIGSGSSITSVAQLIITATTSQPAPTAAPTDTPVLTTVPPSIPTPQPHSTPTPILLTPPPTVTQSQAPLPPGSSDLVLYGDAVAQGFVDRSFGYSSRNPCDTSMFVSPPCSYAISYTAYGGINFYHPGGTISTASYQTLRYELNTNNQPITDFSALFLNSHGRVIKQIRLSSADVTAQLPEGWVQISIPLSLLTSTNVPIVGIQLKNRTDRPLASIHVDDVQLVGF